MTPHLLAHCMASPSQAAIRRLNRVVRYAVGMHDHGSIMERRTFALHMFNFDVYAESDWARSADNNSCMFIGCERVHSAIRHTNRRSSLSAAVVRPISIAWLESLEDDCSKW